MTQFIYCSFFLEADDGARARFADYPVVVGVVGGVGVGVVGVVVIVPRLLLSFFGCC